MTDNPVTAEVGGFEVQLHRSGRTIAVPPGETILDMLLDAGVNVSFSCTEGVCGTCETKVIDGIPIIATPSSATRKKPKIARS